MKVWYCSAHVHLEIIQVGDVRPDAGEHVHARDASAPVIEYVEVPEVRVGVHVGDTDPTLLWLLRRLGSEFGPRGVAAVAAKLASTTLAAASVVPAGGYPLWDPKGTLEKLNVQASALHRQHEGQPGVGVTAEAIGRLSGILNLCRPVGSDGKHGDGERCTPLCGCKR